eukprot:NODE_177_length_14091_cov_0.996141.p12 type:complete len:102 gc:universal NODE_177_length_14091_cov_0.996141:7889-7584(-)
MHCKWQNRCLYITDNLADLYAHAKTHDIRPPYVCEWDRCGRICRKKATLQAHFLTHIPLRSFQCTVCSKSFKRYQERNRHMTLHEKDLSGFRRLKISDLVN